MKNPIKNALNSLPTDISENAYKPLTVEYLQQHPQQVISNTILSHTKLINHLKLPATF